VVLRSSTPCILVADDTEDVRELYAEYLSFCGYDVVQAANGQEAIDLALAKHPAAIVMDLAMPVLDGWEATRRLKADPRSRHVPVIVVTGFAVDDQLRAAKRAGADAVLKKPCNPDSLRTAIDYAVRGEPVPSELCEG
jgi:CheY-like chemotaxis protein